MEYAPKNKGVVLLPFELFEYSLFFISLLGYAGTFRWLTKINLFAVPVVVFSFIICTAYPPGTSLFHYYVVKYFGYSESRALLAHISLTLSAFAAVFGSILPKRPISGAIGFLFALLLVYFFDYSFYTIYVDLVLGAVFAASLVLTRGSKYSRPGLFTVVLMSCTLILIKPSGLVLALILCGQYFGPRIHRGAGLVLQYLRAKKWRNARRLFLVFTALSSVQLLVAAGLSLLTFFSWRMYASLIGGAVVKDVPAVGNLLQEQGAGYDWLVIGNADEKFWRDNGRYFDPKDRVLKNGVFRMAESNGSLKFMLVE